MNIPLSPQQTAFIETFGYLHLPGLLNDRIDKITEAFEQVWAAHGGGHNSQSHDGTARSMIVPFIDQSDYLSSLLEDPRIDGILTSLLGEDYVYLGGDGNYYVGDTPWHSDGGFLDYKRPMLHYKLAFYLDTLTRETGALRVIPGSHKLNDMYAEALERDMNGPSIAVKINSSEERWAIHGSVVPAVALETNPGDVAIFNHATKHSSWGGGTRRRMFTINCTQRFTDEQLPLLRKNITAFTAYRDQHSAYAKYFTDSVYGEAMLRMAGPDRMRHLEQVLANQDHLPAETRKAKETMSEPAR